MAEAIPHAFLAPDCGCRGWRQRQLSEGQPWAVAGGCSPSPLPPVPQATPCPAGSSRGQVPLQTLLPRRLPGARPISLFSQQTTLVAVTQINSNPLDLSGKHVALTCHKSPGRRERLPAPTRSSPRPAAHLPRSPVSR